MKSIVLFCTAGMSTSILVEKLKASAQKLEFDCGINAYSMSRVKEYGPKADLILLAPQIRFNLADVKKHCPGIPVESIDMMDYGTMNSDKIIRRIIEILQS